MVSHAAQLVATVLHKVLNSRNVKLFNGVSVQDLILKPNDENVYEDDFDWGLPPGKAHESRVAGVVRCNALGFGVR